MRGRHGVWILGLLVGATLLASCSSSPKTTTTTTTTGGSGQSTTLGTGVTDKTVKLGVSLVDFTCIQQFVNQIRVNQNSIYDDFIRYVNTHGGVAGRTIVPDYQSFCPIQSGPALALCTKFTEDDHVFGVIGNFVDFSGDAQTCLAKDHNTVLMTFQLSQAIMNQSPPGLIVFPGETPERTDTVLLNLIKKQHTLDGKKIAVLGESTSQQVVNSSVVPGLQHLGVPMGSTAILDITGSDTSAAQTQLDSFIERWKSENVSALFVSGTQVTSQQFIEKVRAAMPNVLLLTDNDATVTLGYGQQERQIGRNPNPYEGIITAAGPTASEYDASANWKFCASVYKEETGQTAPNAETIINGPNGKRLDTYGNINDACQLLLLFQEIGDRVGKNLNVTNWVHTVNTYGPIRDYGDGQYNSLHTGKYDDADTFRLEKFNSSLGPKGDWQAITPLQDVSQ